MLLSTSLWSQSELHPQWISEDQISYYDRSGNVWKFNLSTSERKEVLKGSQPAPNPVIPNLYAVRSKANGESTIVIIDLQRNKHTPIDDPLLDGFNTFHPIWSKDGKRLAFHGENSQLKTSNLFIYDYENQRLSTFLKDKYVGAPSFFSNGDVFVPLIQDNGCHLVRYNTQSDKVTILYESDSRIFFAEPSPSGKELVISSSESGNRDLWLLNIETGSKKQLTNTPIDEYTPRWSPSGKRIVYFVDLDGTYKMRIMDRDGGNVRGSNE